MSENVKRKRLVLGMLLGGSVVLAVTVVSLFHRAVEPVPLNGDLRHDAAVLVVGWVVENRELPGYPESYADAEFMRNMRRFYVVCDFIPMSVKLSNDPRVVRLRPGEAKATFEREGYDGNDYFTLVISEETDDRVSIEIANMFGYLAGHGYKFTCRLVAGQIRVDGEFLWVS